MKALTRAALIVAIASFTSLGVGTSSSAAASDQTMTTKQAVVRDGSHDFDFIYGKWRMPNHRLKERLAGSHEWVNFITCDGGGLCQEVSVIPTTGELTSGKTLSA